jgi:hypothetical protein
VLNLGVEEERDDDAEDLNKELRNGNLCHLKKRPTGDAVQLCECQ